MRVSRKNRFALSTLVFLGCTESGFAASLPGAEVRCDANNDGLITGSELRALANLKVSPELESYDADCDGRISAEELAYINQLVEAAIEKDGGIQEADLIVESGFGPIKVPAGQTKPKEPKQQFFISKDRVTPSLSPVSKSGAVLSFADNRETDTDALAVDMVLTYLFFGADDEAPETGLIGESIIAGYLDLKGSVNSDADDVTSAILGFDTIFDLEATNLFDLQTVSLGPYFLTDFDNKAEAFGLNASWVPIRADWQLGTARVQTGDWREHFLWTASVNVDYREVKKSGETKLAEGEQFWLGVTLGAKLYPFGELGSATPHLTFGLASHQDIRNGDEATLSSVSFDFPLSEDGKSSFSISYENGESYQTGEEIDKTVLGLTFKF